MQNTHPFEQRDNEHIYYPPNRKSKAMLALLLIFCLIVPIFGVTFASILEISFLTGVGGFLIFAAAGAALTLFLLHIFAPDVKCISVYRGGLRIYKTDGSELFYPLGSYAGYTHEYISANSTYKAATLWFQEGDERTALDITYLSDEQKQAIVNDIEILAKTSNFRQTAAQSRPVSQQRPAPASDYQYKKTDPRAYRLMLEKAAQKISINDRIHITKMLTEQRKIEAVKLIRTTTGLGLAEARDLAEEHSDLVWVGGRLEQMSKPTSSPHEDHMARKADPTKYKEYLAQAVDRMGWEDRKQARDFISQQNNIEAIRLVRERTGLGLAEARDIVMEHSELL